jgi:hypothetical protein
VGLPAVVIGVHVSGVLRAAPQAGALGLAGPAAGSAWGAAGQAQGRRCKAATCGTIPLPTSIRPIPAPGVVVCTIEKAHALVQRMLEEDTLHNLGCVVVDELHMARASGGRGAARQWFGG